MNKYVIIRSSVLIAFMLFLSGTINHTIGQDRKVDKIEMFYHQGHYKKVLRRSNALLARPEYDTHPGPTLFKALAYFKLAVSPKTKHKYKNGLEESIVHFKEFKERDSKGYIHTNNIREIEQLKRAYYSRVRKLSKKDEELAMDFYNQLEGFFNHHATYDEVVQITSTPTPVVTEPITTTPILASELRDSIIVYANQFMGIPYQWGGNGPDKFDCSGFTRYVLNKHGMQIPRIAGDQYEVSAPVKKRDAQKGDLVFFGSKKGNDYNITHVGIVVSNPGEALSMIHASSSKGIMISNIEQSDYWKAKLLFTGNIIDELSKN